MDKLLLGLVSIVPGLMIVVFLMTILPVNSSLVVFGIASSIIIGAIIYVHRLPNPSIETIFPNGSEYEQPNRKEDNQ